jgi:DNA invertase Pin-like site-specific DNA recombinase
MEILTVHEARQRLITWQSWTQMRDEFVRQAFASGVSKAEIHRLTGIARTTIDRILAEVIGFVNNSTESSIAEGNQNARA